MKKGRGILMISILLFSLSLFPLASAQVVINEVLYDPSSEQGGTYQGELIEIYNQNAFEVDLSGWILKDNGSPNTSLNGIIPAFGYGIIADDPDNFNQTWNISSLVIDGNLGLNNNGDQIWLWDQSENLVDYLDYEDLAEQGNSTQLIDSEWQACTPTPGQENSCQEPEPGPECQIDEDCDDNDENTIDSCQEGTCFYEQVTQQPQQEQESSLAIVDSQDEATFGDILDIKVEIYRGDTRKYAVYIRVEDNEGKEVSEEVILHVFTKYVNYSMKVPIQLKLNCDNKYDDNDYDIIIEGLDERISQEINLAGKSSLCSSTSASSSSSSTSSSTSSTSSTTTSKNEPMTYQNENEENEADYNEITGQVIETNSATTLKTIPYLLSVLCVLIVAYVIKRKNGK